LRSVTALFASLLLWFCALLPDRVFALLVRSSSRFLVTVSAALRSSGQAPQNCSTFSDCVNLSTTHSKLKKRKQKHKNERHPQTQPSTVASHSEQQRAGPAPVMPPRRRVARKGNNRRKNGPPSPPTTAQLLKSDSPLGEQKRQEMAAALAELAAMDNAYNLLRSAGPRRTRHNQNNQHDNPNDLFGLGEVNQGVWRSTALDDISDRMIQYELRKKQLKMRYSMTPMDPQEVWWEDDLPCDEGSLSRRQPDIPAGLCNLGATCYMNALLQSLFMNHSFRQGVYEWTPSLEISADEQEVCGELRALFARLELGSQTAQSPQAITDLLHIKTGIQQDVQEFNHLFLDYLEERFRNSPSPRARTLMRQFHGGIEYHTECRGCGHISRRGEGFNHLLVPIQQMKKLENGLSEFFATETLEGDNRYRCSGCGELQDAERRVCLASLPEVLNLQLNRFVFDMGTGTRRKLNASISFPLTLRLNKSYMTADLVAELAAAGNTGQVVNMDASADADAAAAAAAEAATAAHISAATEQQPPTGSTAASTQSDDGSTPASTAGASTAASAEDDDTCVYELASVLVHLGTTAFGGHYIAYSRVEGTDQWYKFDDTSVTKMKGSSLSEDSSMQKLTKPGGGGGGGGARRKKRSGRGRHRGAAKTPEAVQATEVEASKQQARVSSSNAYMLVYVRRNRPLPEVNPPEEIREEIERSNSRLRARVSFQKQIRSHVNKLLSAHKEEYNELIDRWLPPTLARGKCYWVPTEWLRSYVCGEFIDLPVSIAKKSRSSSSSSSSSSSASASAFFILLL